MSAGSEQTSPVADQWVIEPRGRNVRARLLEVWTFRRLFAYFGMRAVERLYQSTALGAAWLFIRPLFPLAINAFVFGGVLGIKSPGVPYFLFLLVGSSIWDLFSSGLMWATRSLQLNRGLLGRMYFPRIIVPIATLAVAFVNFFITLAVLIGALIYYRITDGLWYLAGPGHLVWALVAVVLAATFALAIGLWTAPMNAQYRDVRFTLSMVLGFWALLTPVMYPVSAVPPRYVWVVYLNPLAGIVQAFKWGVLGIESLQPTILAIDTALVLGVLLSGFWYFARAEGDAVDRI
jgi:lipopolysaccharide transport system permease protein